MSTLIAHMGDEKPNIIDVSSLVRQSMKEYNDLMNFFDSAHNLDYYALESKHAYPIKEIKVSEAVSSGVISSDGKTIASTQYKVGLIYLHLHSVDTISGIVIPNLYLNGSLSGGGASFHFMFPDDHTDVVHGIGSLINDKELKFESGIWENLDTAISPQFRTVFPENIKLTTGYIRRE